MPRLIISNTSPMYYLHQIGQLELLQKLYKHIIVPKAVVDELDKGRKKGLSVPNISEYNWIETRSVKVPGVIGLITDLGAGEAEVLALAMEISNSLCILDDSLAREVAKYQKISFTGTAGVLIVAKRKGYISQVAPHLDELIQAGLWIRDDTRTAVLKIAKEL